MRFSTRATGERLHQKTQTYCAKPVVSKQPRSYTPVDYEIRAVMQHCVYQRQIHSVDELEWRLIDVC